MAMDKPRSGESHSIIRLRGLNESTSVLNNCIRYQIYDNGTGNGTALFSDRSSLSI